MMPRIATCVLTTLVPIAILTAPALADSTGSVGCTAITQSAQDGMVARTNADASTIAQPQSVHSMGCLGGFFSGIGLNLVTNLLNPANLLSALETQVCNAIQTAWNDTVGSIHCGLTLTGFNFGFGGIGGGLSCPTISFGGGGPPIASIGIGVGGGGGLYITGSGMTPTGYSAPNVPPGMY